MLENLYITTVKILAINRSTKCLKAESTTKTTYKHYNLSHASFTRSLRNNLFLTVSSEKLDWEHLFRNRFGRNMKGNRNC